MTVDLRLANDYDELSWLAAEVIAGCVRAKPDARVLVATGQTPMGAYAVLGRMAAAGTLDASRVTAFQLDEYLDLGPDDGRSLERWARETFLEPLGIADERFVRLPLDGDAGLAAFDRRVRQDGGYDLSILGIGGNGHLGFNEPPCEAASPSRVVELTGATMGANARYWGEDAPVPRRAVTVGLAPLLDSRTVLLLASGTAKREILRRALFGPVTPDVPASFLQRSSGRVVVMADRAALPDRPDCDGAPT